MLLLEVERAMGDEMPGVRLTPRFCPRCIATLGFHDFLWTMPFVLACPTHRCGLIDRCHRCYETYRWSALQHGYLCRCGARVGEARAESARPTEVAFARALCAASEVRDWRVASSFPIPARVAALKLTVRSLYRLVAWAWSMRNEVTKGRKVYQRLRRNVNALDLSIALRLRASVASFVDRAVRGRAFGRPGALVLFQEVLRSDRALRLIEEYIAEDDGPAKFIREVLEGIKASHSVGVRSLPGLVFSPTLSPGEMAEIERCFREWWATLAKRMEGVQPDHVIAIETSGRLIYEPPPDVEHKVLVTLLSWLQHAASSRLPAETFAALTARWQPPLALLRPGAGLAEVATELCGLGRAELAYVLELVDVGFAKLASNAGRDSEMMG